MRLAPAITDSLRRCLAAALPTGAQARLFGSRVDDNARGGDIDICVIAPPELVALVRAKKSQLRAQLRQAAGDQRVDLSIVTPDEAAHDPFWSHALRQSVALLG